MKKIFGVLIAIISVFLLASCEKETTELTTTEPPITTTEPWSVKVSEYSLLDYNDEYNLTHDKLHGYYFNESLHKGNETLLYVDFDEFLEALDGYLLYEEFKFEKSETKYKVFWTYEDEETHETEDYNMEFDLDKETVTIDLYFPYNTPEMEETDYSYSLYTDEDMSYSNEDYTVTYNFEPYDIDFFLYEGKYMMPYWVANYFLNTLNYCNIFFNKREFIFCYCDLRGLSKSDLNKVRNNPMVNKKASEKEREDQMNQIAFIFENIFGVKDSEGFEKFDEVLNSVTRKQLTSQTGSNILGGYKALCYSLLDDLHTYVTQAPFYQSDNSPSVSRSDIGAYYSEFLAIGDALGKARAAAGLSGRNYIRFYDDTAIIILDGFDTGETNKLKDEDGNILSSAKDIDSFYLFRYCMEEIEKHNLTAEKPVKNVIVDLSNNGGGNVGAMIRCLGYFVKDIYVEDYYKGYNHISSTCYHVDTNMDGECDSSDVYSQYNWSVLVSGTSYSASNSFAICAKQAGIKLIGQKTGGGMCSITPLALIDGTSIYTSSPTCTTFYPDRAEGVYEFTDVQYGIEVDFEIEDYANFYNDEYLDSVADSLYSK